MTRADRYIAKIFTAYFFSGLLVFITLFVSVDYMSSLSSFQVPFGVILQYYGFYLPSVVHQIMPMACLLATLFTFGNLQKHNELTALFSAGMSLARVSTPILVLNAFIAATVFYIGDQVMPAFAKKKNYVYLVDIVKQPGLYSMVKENKIWYRSKESLFNIKTLNIKKRQAQQLTLYNFDRDWNLVQLITAQEVALEPEQWILTKGTITLFTEDSSFPLSQTFEKKTISIGEDIADLQIDSGTVDALTQKDLKRFISKNKEAGLDTVHYEVDYHAKFSFAAAPFLLSLLAIPFSLFGPRSSGRTLKIAKCIGLAFFYWAMHSSSITLGRHGVLLPSVAAWGANVLIGVIAAILLLRIRK